MTGRSERAEVRNPVLALPAARAILALPAEQRRLIGQLFREIAAEADAKAETAWHKRKGPMAAYWRAACTYAKHIARAIERPAQLAAIPPAEVPLPAGLPRFWQRCRWCTCPAECSAAGYCQIPF